MSHAAPKPRVEPAQGAIMGRVAFVLAIVGLVLSGCAVVVLEFLPDAVKQLGPLRPWPYSLAGASAFVFGLLAAIFGSVSWGLARRQELSASLAIAAFTLGLVGVLAGLSLAAIDSVYG